MNVAPIIFALLRNNLPDLLAVSSKVGLTKAASLVDPAENIVSSLMSGGVKAVLAKNVGDISTVISDLAPEIAQVAPNLANLADAVNKQDPSVGIPVEFVNVLRNAGGDLQTVLQEVAPVLAKVSSNISALAAAATTHAAQATSHVAAAPAAEQTT